MSGTDRKLVSRMLCGFPLAEIRLAVEALRGYDPDGQYAPEWMPSLARPS